MKFKNIFIVTFIVLIPVALFWGCGSSSQPISPSSSSTLTLQIPPVGAHSEFVPAAQNMILYNLSGAGASVTGSYGPLTASAAAGQINFSIKLPANVGTYDLISLEIVDNTTQVALAVGAASLSSGSNLTVTLGPLNKLYYQVSSLPTINNGFGFESDTETFVGANTATTVAGIDVVSNVTSTNSGYELDDPALVNNTVAYMGNGNFVNYLKVPTNFSKSSSLSKKAVVGGTVPPVAVGDVYCVKMKAGGYAWLQITSAGVVGTGQPGPSFLFRLNTTLPYCGYEQSTSDLAAFSGHGTPTPYAPVTVFSGFTGPTYGVAAYPMNGPATEIFVADAGAASGTAMVRVFNTVGVTIMGSLTGSFVWPAGVAINSTGTTVFVADPNNHTVDMYQTSAGYYTDGTAGPGIQAPSPDAALAAGAAKMASPEYVALDPVGNLYITDASTGGFADVMVIDPVINTSSAATTYWSGYIGSGTNSVGIATDGTKVYVANSGKNQIETYNVNGLFYTSWTTDNNSTGAMAFSGPQGIALDSTLGLLFIADTGNNRVVEMNTYGTYIASWGTWGLGTAGNFSGPTGIAVDGANPPNVYVSDSGNKRVLRFKGF